MYLIDIIGDGGVLTNVEDLYLWDQNFYNVYVKDKTLMAGVGFLPEAFEFKPALKDEFEVAGSVVTFKRDAEKGGAGCPAPPNRFT